MNILVINWQDWDNPNAGGAEVHLREVFSRLAQRGHTVVLLCSRGEGQTHRSERNGFVILRTGQRTTFNFLVPGVLSQLVSQYRIDVICDDLNKIPFYSPWFVKRPVVALVHHLFRKTIYRETNALLASYVYGAESIIPWCYHDTPFVAVSESTCQDLVNMGIEPHHIHIVYNGIALRKRARAVARQKNLIVYVGRIKQYKSIDHFLRAAALVRTQRSIRIMVVGDGDGLPGLKDVARHMNIDVHFTGYMSEEEKYRIYAQARAAVQPSVKEGWGLTALEAQSCGTPVICADSPGLREAVSHGKTGFLYPYGNIEQCAHHMQTLLDDDALWQTLSNGARTWAQNFSWDTAAQKIEAIFQDVVKAHDHA
ncbi:glycosyltransferase family 4 protein [candidate division WOR-3 bacterium]|nr:glycosyltransferase family 4 protein [candidate division WOR-3 bacterium]